MTTLTRDPRAGGSVEHELVTHPRFGDATAIRTNVCDMYRFVGDVVGLTPDLPAATVLDPALRIALNGALHAFRVGEPTPPVAARILAAGSEGRLDAETTRLPLKDSASEVATGRSGRGLRLPVWDPRPGSEVADWFEAFFAAQLAETGLPGAARLAPLDPPARDLVGAALDLLADVVPAATASVFAHCALIAGVQPDPAAPDGLFESASFDEIPGVLFLSPLALGSVEQAAEAILHEAVHQKLTDLRQTIDLLRPGYDFATAATIEAPWTATRSWNSARWDVDRALAAAHVYTHLSLLHLRLDPESDRAGAVLSRAAYLTERLDEQDETDLRAGGHEFVRWLRAQVAALMSASPATPITSYTGKGE